MVPKPQAGALKRAPIQRLAVDQLKVKNARNHAQNPCVAVMTAVLGCWASQGHAAANCLVIEQSLRACMDTKAAQMEAKNPINHHLKRFYKSFRGPVKDK